MNFDAFNYVWVPIVLFLICGIPYYKTFFKNLTQPRFLKVFFNANPLVKYLVYLAVFGASCSLLTGLAQFTSSKFILEVERIIFVFHIYAFVCFVYLTVNPLSQIPGLIQKWLYSLSLTVCLIQIICMTFGMESTEEMLSFDTIVARFNNNWLWLAGVSILSFALLCVGGSLVILVRARGSKVYSKQWFSYRVFSLILLSGFQVVIYSLDLIGHLLSRIGPWQELGHNSSKIHAILINFLVFPFFLLLPLDKLTLKLYDRVNQYFARRYTEKLHWLHSKAFEKLHASYSFDPYEFFEEPKELLDHVTISLNDFRTLLYRSIGEDYQINPATYNFSFDAELKFWGYYLGINSKHPALPSGNELKQGVAVEQNLTHNMKSVNLVSTEAKPLHSAKFYLKLSNTLRSQQALTYVLPAQNLDLELFNNEATQTR